ncbi:Probable ADP-ribosylation factor GTPase-activating protein AGD9, partial [Linum grandiflorum]
MDSLATSYFFLFDRSMTLDSWSPEHLRILELGGNNRAQAFFKQHGWNDGGKTASSVVTSWTRAKYTSRAAELYRQILSEVAKADALSEVAPVVTSCTVEKPFGTKRTGKSGGLSARKFTTKIDENMYDQKPEEAPLPAPSSSKSTQKAPASRFEYAETVSGGSKVDSHLSDADLGMESSLPEKRNSNSSKVQTRETDEARKRFSNTKSISSAQFFSGQDRSAADSENRQQLSANLREAIANALK